MFGGDFAAILNGYSKHSHLAETFFVEVVCLDSTTVKVHPDVIGALKKEGSRRIGRSRGGLTTKIHAGTASDRSAVSFSLSCGARHDSPKGMKLLSFTPASDYEQSLLMDRAYEGDNMRAAAIELGTSLLFRRRKTVLTHVNMTWNSTYGKMRLNVSSEESNVSGRFSLAAISSISSLPVLSCPLWLSML